MFMDEKKDPDYGRNVPGKIVYSQYLGEGRVGKPDDDAPVRCSMSGSKLSLLTVDQVADIAWM